MWPFLSHVLWDTGRLDVEQHDQNLAESRYEKKNNGEKMRRQDWESEMGIDMNSGPVNRSIHP